ncbi:MAG: ornithine carbamoyltransferase [Candidatus Omnitrophota bacterium]|jgi:ornithine carbamoyltransferase
MKKDFITIADLNKKQINDILLLAADIKKRPEDFREVLKAKTLALIFEKPSNRTYVSFQVGMYQLGGNSIYLGPEHIKLGVRETIADVAKTLSRYVNAIVLRTFAHKNVVDMAQHAGVPVINGLSDLLHPCQGLTDIFTVKEKTGRYKNMTMAYIGDGNNVCHSLLHSCSKVGLNLHIATPFGYEPDPGIVKQSRIFAKDSGSIIELFTSPQKAVRGTDVIYTDVWASMGQEEEAAKRKKIFAEFQINQSLLKLAKKNVFIMHCLPAHRGDEITDGVINSKNSVVFDQAENRLHVQKAILIKLLT